jgi:hypothetical protein
MGKNALKAQIEITPNSIWGFEHVVFDFEP